MTDLSDEIHKLRAEGLSYREIQNVLGCSKSTIAYHLTPGEREKSAVRRDQLRKENVFLRKTTTFKSSTIKSKANKITHFHATGKDTYDPQHFTWRDVENEIGDNPTCYLTGDVIDLSLTSTYEFDHIIPRSRGGTNDLFNLGLTTREANRAKQDLLLDEFLDLCEKVLRYHGRI